MLSDAFVGTVVGAAIAGAVGVLTLFVQQGLERRQRVNEEILRPAFDFAADLPVECPFVSLGEPPWRDLDTYARLRLPRRSREAIAQLSTALEAYSRANGSYFEFYQETKSSFETSVSQALAKYAQSDASTIPARSLGIDSSATLQVQNITPGLMPSILLAEGEEKRAWERVTETSPTWAFWSVQIVRALLRTDRVALTLLFNEVGSNPNANRGRDLAASVATAYLGVHKSAVKVRDTLAARLGIRKSLLAG